MVHIVGKCLGKYLTSSEIRIVLYSKKIFHTLFTALTYIAKQNSLVKLFCRQNHPVKFTSPLRNEICFIFKEYLIPGVRKIFPTGNRCWQQGNMGKSLVFTVTGYLQIEPVYTKCLSKIHSRQVLSNVVVDTNFYWKQFHGLCPGRKPLTLPSKTKISNTGNNSKSAAFIVWLM
jgi:hypothetical protein